MMREKTPFNFFKALLTVKNSVIGLHLILVEISNLRVPEQE